MTYIFSPFQFNVITSELLHFCEKDVNVLLLVYRQMIATAIFLFCNNLKQILKSPQVVYTFSGSLCFLYVSMQQQKLVEEIKEYKVHALLLHYGITIQKVNNIFCA